MAAYLIATVNVTDFDRYKEYTKVTPGIITKFGGRFLVRGGEVVTLEGPEETKAGCSSSNFHPLRRLKNSIIQRTTRRRRNFAEAQQSDNFWPSTESRAPPLNDGDFFDRFGQDVIWKINI